MDNQSNIKYIFNEKEYLCSLELAMELIGGKWKTLMLYHLKDGAMRSGDLQRSLPGIANKMFTQTARELERTGLVQRIVHPVVPPKVEYKLTDKGESVIPVLFQLGKWGADMSEIK
ncbi:MAG: winged helix-turn-helix transcriptional regulator [Bacteroidales bacterium]